MPRNLTAWDKFSIHYKIVVSCISAVALILAGVAIYFGSPYHKSAYTLGIIAVLQFFVGAILDQQEMLAEERDKATTE